ncbi:bifunctional heptose 7-phosphate kinase/heptose 1-phosphate adenyltransferase [Oleiphilus sp. HI0009]|nr:MULTISPECIES: bifunctional D-glycero-beta-D-manno-heptose-7-phosphate kinase/D-glycero-beta-D-manno-heptose 1-phosphate adenylyltransferase HldE [unclassified Oleiphilus]KZX76454.1 bifunctional heptose 7-phosphate kinase/heptose 1-phosphate adenyltransferase [Oleiphilus sp. HI0009]MCH2158986.1 bifunctional D-glycero-beta-D-manno-heptose-7-phosphate kinase/D-glycero-beta-D-manno-heptose 1-phosphate adenylyltransferase HldE [Oleiphilaceae bacterium]KZY63518.1 bifunctional heptose 7-phosphate ki
MFDISVLDHLSDLNILVVGDVMLDRYWQGDSQRISPEAPVPVVKINNLEDRIGGAANVARNIAHLNGQVSLMGLIGNDENADRLEAMLATDKVSSALIRQDQQPTITKLRVISRHQQVVRLDFEELFADAHAQTLKEQFIAQIDNYDFVIFSDYNKGSLRYVGEMIHEARKRGKTILVDPKSSDLSVYRGAHVITPNLKEFIAAGGQTDSEESIHASAKALMAKCDLDAILLTRSEQGMSVITPSSKHDMPTRVLEVADVTGAGDTVIGTLALMMAAGTPLEDAAQIANLAAGVVVAKLGAETVSPEELYQIANRVFFEHRGTRETETYEETLRHIELAKLAGEKIVFTNGCFDILHAGHVRYLEKARALGDRLVLGLNSDESVKRLKGETRPVNGYEERATVIGGLASVDWVLPFGEVKGDQYDDTPFYLIETVMPDVLAKGGDYTIDTIVGADIVQKNGGQVAVIDFVDGCSTTRIIEKIQQHDDQ